MECRFFRSPRNPFLLAIAGAGLLGGAGATLAGEPLPQAARSDVGVAIDKCLQSLAGISVIEAMVLVDAYAGSFVLEASQEYQSRRDAITSLTEKGLITVNRMQSETGTWISVVRTEKGASLASAIMSAAGTSKPKTPRRQPKGGNP